MQEIVKQIKQELKNRKITYEQFSKMCNMPKGTLTNIFAGTVPNPRIDTINAMLEALDMHKYEKTPQGTFLTTQEQRIVDLLINCTEREQELIECYIAGLRDRSNIGNAVVNIDESRFKNNK